MLSELSGCSSSSDASSISASSSSNPTSRFTFSALCGRRTRLGEREGRREGLRRLRELRTFGMRFVLAYGENETLLEDFFVTGLLFTDGVFLLIRLGFDLRVYFLRA